MSGARSRRKGAAYERQLAKRFTAVFGEECRRGLQMQGGGVVPDVVCPEFWPEAKVGAAPNVWAAMRQAERDSAESNKTPIVVAKRHQGGNKPAVELVVMRLEDWESMATEWWFGRKA